MPDPTFESSDGTVDANAGRLQFGIFEIMLLVTASALALWAHERLMIFQAVRPQNTDFWQSIFQARFFVDSLLSLTGLLLFVHCFARGKRFIRHPGHAFLCVYGIGVLAKMVGSFYVGLQPGTRLVDLAVLPIAPVHLVGSLQQIYDVLGFQMVIAILIYLFASFRFRGFWQICFLFLIVTYILNAILTVLIRTRMEAFLQLDPELHGYLNALGVPIACTVICAVLSICWASFSTRNRIQYDWKHWLGLALFFLNLVGNRLLLMLSSLFP